MYDVSGSSNDRNCVVLNDIHIDIMDYIMPASCTDTEFRQMWAEFEWENKVMKLQLCVTTEQSDKSFRDLADLWVIKIRKPVILCALSTPSSSEQSTKRTSHSENMWKVCLSLLFCDIEKSKFIFL